MPHTQSFIWVLEIDAILVLCVSFVPPLQIGTGWRWTAEFLFSSCFGKLISSICFLCAVWCVSRLLRFFGVLVNYQNHCVSQFPPEINPEAESRGAHHSLHRAQDSGCSCVLPPLWQHFEAASASYALWRQRTVNQQLHDRVFCM